MKKILIIVCIAFVAMSAFVAKNTFQSGITGSIDPPEGAKTVWAIKGTDSVSAVPSSGKFSITVKPGTWMLVVETVKPYKSTAVQNIVVLEGSPTDAGVIKLEKE